MNQATRSTFTISDPYYMTPENIELINAVQKGDKTNPTKEKASIKPGKQCDIFAAGILLLEMCHGERPIDEKKTEDIMLYEHKTHFKQGVDSMKNHFKHDPDFANFIETRILTTKD